jgi:AraC family transcriptional regulator of adaptative response/methylated-DNA-[protein]-cysteine methyltransferase
MFADMTAPAIKTSLKASLKSPPEPSPRAENDYDRVRQALAFVAHASRRQPEVEEIAQAVGLTPARLHELFKRWAGLTPKGFLQAVTLDHARRLLADSASVLDAAYEVGLSGPGRLHDLFVTYEALSPGEYKAKGAGLTFRYGYHPSPFGEAIIVATPRGLAGLGWTDGDQTSALNDMRRRWPAADFLRDDAATAAYAARAFNPAQWRADRPLRVALIGADFEIKVWETLLKIPVGRATTYSDIARKLDKPKAARAVGAAVGRNPISFVVPCHRVLGKSGALTGYHWGVQRKQAIIGWEAGCVS